jgi:GLPGLI family protein
MQTNIITISLFSFWCCFTPPIIAQDPVLIDVKYEFIHVKDFDNPNKQFKQEFILSVGKVSSRYISTRLYDSFELSEQKLNEVSEIQNSGNLIVVTGYPGLTVNNNGALVKEEILKYSNKNKLIVYGQLGFKDFTYSTDIPKINWIIKSETKLLGDITCQKAVGVYAERTYTAWFAPSIPLNDGPWKLSGLPGLILEAYDSKKEVMFLFKELSKTNDPTDKIFSYVKSIDDIPTSFKAYSRLKAAFETDPIGICKTQFPNTRIGISNIESDLDMNATSLKVNNYNPLELR